MFLSLPRDSRISTVPESLRASVRSNHRKLKKRSPQVDQSKSNLVARLGHVTVIRLLALAEIQTAALRHLFGTKKAENYEVRRE